MKKMICLFGLLQLSQAMATDINVRINKQTDQSLLSILDNETCKTIKRSTRDTDKVNCIINEQKDNQMSERFQVNLKKVSENIYKLSIHDNTEANSEIATTSWTITPTDLNDLKKVANKLAAKYFNMKTHQREFLEYVLANNVQSSKVIALDSNFDYVNVKNGKKIGFHEALDLYKNENPKQKNLLQTSLSIAAVLGLGQIAYYASTNINAIDWEYGFTWQNLRKRVTSTDRMRFDSNDFYINSLGHPLSGLLYHNSARANGYGFFESFLFGVTSSTIWEFFGEFKEKVSVNDLINTPIAGSVMGEVTYRLSNQILRKFKNSKAAKVFSNIIDPVGYFNRAINKQTRKDQIEQLGFDYNFFDKLEFELQKSTDNSFFTISFNSKIYDIEGVNQAGEITKIISAGDISESKIRSSIGNEGYSDFELMTKIAVGGVYKQYIEQDAKDNLNGYSYFIGLSSNYTYDSVNFDNGKYLDKIGVVNILGPTIEVQYFWKGFHIRALMEVMGNFSQVKSLAIQKLEDSGYDLSQTKYVAKQQKYVFAGGFTFNNEINIDYKNLGLSGSLTHYRFNSIEGIDRYQEKITDDFNTTDHRTNLKFSAEYRLAKFIKATFEYNKRWVHSEAKDVVAKTDLGRSWLGIKTSF